MRKAERALHIGCPCCSSGLLLPPHTLCHCVWTHFPAKATPGAQRFTKGPPSLAPPRVQTRGSPSPCGESPTHERGERVFANSPVPPMHRLGYAAGGGLKTVQKKKVKEKKTKTPSSRNNYPTKAAGRRRGSAFPGDSPRLPLADGIVSPRRSEVRLLARSAVKRRPAGVRGEGA
ncbi:hypothetical protein KIL84_012124 [Mauremys mutica]|uniref:Uncharacterized protein n=1 Tax=Mauremys mutica TaxID=74926 RepID=A0A9D4AVZ9_9SAUR|nr:hypothetical protein KIL84_012124 [Mauremys mutica]